MNGARYLAEVFKAYGVSHVFYVDAILRKAMVDFDELGIRRILTHSEKAAAYMADGYARISGKPGICLAQSVGAANLAAALQDAHLAKSPVIAITGKKPPQSLYRNAYQEVDHWPLFEPVTKYNVDVTQLKQLPHFAASGFSRGNNWKTRPGASRSHRARRPLAGGGRSELGSHCGQTVHSSACLSPQTGEQLD